MSCWHMWWCMLIGAAFGSISLKEAPMDAEAHDMSPLALAVHSGHSLHTFTCKLAKVVNFVKLIGTVALIPSMITR